MVAIYKKYVQSITIFNSLYLSYTFLEGFLLEKNIKQLANNFTITIFVSPLILLTLFNFSLIKKKFIYFSNFTNLLIAICLLILSGAFLAFIFRALENNTFKITFQVLCIILEILSILFAIQKEREQRIMKLIGFFSLCFFTGVATFSSVGIFEKYFFNYSFSNTIVIIYTAFFFHLFNACFLFYASIPKTAENSYTIKQ